MWNVTERFDRTGHAQLSWDEREKGRNLRKKKIVQEEENSKGVQLSAWGAVQCSWEGRATDREKETVLLAVFYRVPAMHR